MLFCKFCHKSRVKEPAMATDSGKKLFVGPRFRRIRQQLGLSQTQIAEGLGISPSYINLIERNQRPVTAQILLRLAETYDLDLRDLATADEDRFFAEPNEIVTRIMPVDVMRETLRRFDRHRRQLLISELVDGSGRAFQLALQIGLAECSASIDAIVNRAGPLDDTPRRLYRITLANYFAAAVMMPYQAFHTAAENLNYDVHVLAQRFNAGFEQVCHRLTTLQRPNARGVPFFLLRVDNAGNVSKTFSSGTFPFSKFGGTCPLWNVHSTFDTPDRLLKQVIELPDGTRYFSIAQMVRRPVAPHPLPQPRFAIGLGCEIRHASRLVYATGMDLEKAEGTPIGVNCRLCERENCSQRAEPPITRTLILDETTRRVSSFSFSNAREL